MTNTDMTQMNMTIVALVAVVAIVGLVALVMNAVPATQGLNMMGYPVIDNEEPGMNLVGNPHYTGFGLRNTNNLMQEYSVVQADDEYVLLRKRPGRTTLR